MHVSRRDRNACATQHVEELHAITRCACVCVALDECVDGVWRGCEALAHHLVVPLPRLFYIFFLVESLSIVCNIEEKRWSGWMKRVQRVGGEQ